LNSAIKKDLLINKTMHPTYWDTTQKVIREKIKPDRPMLAGLE